MADQRLTDKTEKATAVDNDIFHVVDTSNTSQSPSGSSFWMKLSTIKTYLKNYFDTLYTSNEFKIVSTTSSATLTGTTSTTKLVENILIPAGTFAVGDIIRIKCRVDRTVVTSGNTGITMAFSPTINDMVGNLTGTNKKYTGDVITGTNRYVQVEHDIIIKSATVSETISFTTFFDNTQSVNKITNNTDWTVDQYFYILLNNVQTDTSSFITSYSIERIRQT